jgi:hypothetical protein
MPENPFAAVLTEELADQQPTQESLQVLQDFCSGIELSTRKRVICTLERGHLVNYGQEWRLVIRSSKGGPSQTLFRAYVLMSKDWPMVLDLHQGALTEAQGKDECVRMLQDFLRDPNVVTQIRYVMEFPRQPS